jgi:putative flippase GtrA
MTAPTTLIGKGLRYLLTGGSAAIVDVIAFTLLLRLGLSIPGAATGSFALGTITNYWLSSRHVFGAERRFDGYLRFLVGASFGLAINVGLTSWLAGPPPGPALAHFMPLPPIVAKVISIAVSFVFNFAINLLIVFRNIGPRPDAS